MFTYTVSWWLVAFIPVLLMLAALALGRLETRLADGTLTASDVVEFLEQAEHVDMDMLAREGMPQALARQHRRRCGRATDRSVPQHRRVKHPLGSLTNSALIFAVGEEGLPTQRHRHSRTNGQFRPPRHANRV